MITDIQQFRLYLESLSSERTMKMKLALLIQTAREMVDAYAKQEAFEAAKKAKNEEVKALLNELGAHSIIAKGVLIEVVGTYDNHSTSLTDYTAFVEKSVDVLGKQYKEMHDKIKEANTRDSEGYEYLKFNKNTKNAATGTMEGIGSTIMGWIASFKNWASGFLRKSKAELADIQAQLKLQTVTGESVVNENSAPDNSLLIKTLEKAKELVDEAEQEKFYLELAKTKEKQVIALLEEFGKKKIAIDDKIIQLIKVGSKPTLDKAEFMNQMSNAEIVTESVAEMAQSLFAMYTKTFQTAGSVRQYQDDKNLPEGTLNATFDWILKTVVAPANPNENKLTEFIAKIVAKIRRFISNFRVASKRLDMALSHI